MTYAEYFELVAKGLALLEEQIKEAQLFTQQEHQKALQSQVNETETNKQQKSEKEKKTKEN